MKKLLPAVLAACLLVPLGAAVRAYGQDENTVEEIRERIREREEEAKEEAEQEAREDEEDALEQDEEDECLDLGCQLFAKILYELLWDPSSPLRGEPPPGFSPWGNLDLDVDGAWLFQDRWSLAGRLTLNLRYLHLHAFSQVLFDPTGYLACYAANAGLNLMWPFLILNLFAGAFGTDLTAGALLDFGVEARVFLSARWVLELYNLNAVYYSLRFHFLWLALRYAGNHVSLGAGLNLSNYAGILLVGPALRLCFWL